MTNTTKNKKLNIKPSIDRVLKVLSERNASMLSARYGIGDARANSRQTLESIGRKYNITRERVRQIEEASYIKIRNSEQFEGLEPISNEVVSFIDERGGVVLEEDLMKTLVSEGVRPYLSLMLVLVPKFVKIKESDEHRTSWAIDATRAQEVETLLATVINKINKLQHTLIDDELASLAQSENSTTASLPLDSIFAFLAISKRLQKGPFGKWGLSHWAEINPRGVRDKAYLVFDRESKPLHFREIARLIDSSNFQARSQRVTHPQTVHNELIKDDRFVLVGRGIYALSQWGYTPGTVKDVIINVMQKEARSLDKDYIVAKVLAARMVQENTILLNLQNKKYFKKTQDGKYCLA